MTFPPFASALVTGLPVGGRGDVWLEVFLGLAVLAVVFTTAGWLRAWHRLTESLREQENLANSSMVIEEERRMLELIAKGARLEEVLGSLTKAIERISPGAICTVMLLDEAFRRYLSVVSGPSVAPDYLQALKGLEIGPEVGACGSAAFLNETVIVEDIATDPRFEGAREFVMSHGMRACWSQPIRDSRNRVLGTFAMYHTHPARPRAHELQIARAAAQLAGNAIERLRAEKALRQTSKRLNLAERVARFGIWEADFPHGTITVSKGMSAMLEIPPGKLCLTVDEFEAGIHPDDLPSLRAAMDPANAHEGTIQKEFRLVLPDGTIRWMRGQWRFEPTESLPTRATGAMIDITEERKMLAESQEARAAAEAAARAARQAEKLEQDRKTVLEMVAMDQPLDRIARSMARAISSHLPDSLCSIQIELNDGSRICGFSLWNDRLARALDRIPLSSIHQTLSAEPLRNLSALPEWSEFPGDCGDFPYQCYRAAPILRSARLAGVIISFSSAESTATQSEENLLESWGQFASLAVERRGLYEQLSFRAQYDSLTTLLNRASLYDRVDAHIRKTHPDRAAMAVLYLDLDRFKEINDNYGHSAGDKVLQDVSRRILDSIRRTDFAARIGGDEFVVILPGVSERQEADRVAQLLVRAIEEPILFNGIELSVGASLGISIYPQDGAHTDALLKKADEDMYRAKMRRRSFRSFQNQCEEQELVSTSPGVHLKN